MRAYASPKLVKITVKAPGGRQFWPCRGRVAVKTAESLGIVREKQYLCSPNRIVSHPPNLTAMEGDLIHTNRWMLPISWIYGLVMWCRNLLFDWGVLESRHYAIPVISVGNITVGGTGKTPHIEYLIRLLSPRYRVAVLSRGYKRKSNGYVLAGPDTPMEQIGDEPWQMRQKFDGIYVAVDSNRRRGIERLTTDEATRDVQVILLDDAFQHRYVRPGLNILLTDYHRLITQDRLLPAGRLRESSQGKERAHMVVVTKCPQDMSPMQYRIISESLQLRPYQGLYFSTFRYGRMVNLATGDMCRMAEKTSCNVLLLTGIGCPGQMYMDLKHRFASVQSMEFADHHYYCPDDMKRMAETLERMPSPHLVITTEKDVTRLISMDCMPEGLAEKIWVLPIGVHLLQKKETLFNTKITGYVHKNLTDGRVAEGQDAGKA